MPIQNNLFGEETFVHTKDIDDVKELLRKYPAFAQDSGKFLFVAMKERLPWVNVLSEDQQNDLRHFLGSTINLNRRRQEILSEFAKKDYNRPI